MSISPNETLISGSWTMIDGRMTPDSVLQRIRLLLEHDLEFVAVSPNGWDRLYRDPSDHRYWERFLPHGEMQGGGPESLRVLDSREAQEKYGLLKD